MNFPEIRFGTDGWRAILGEAFTTDRFQAVIDAIDRTPLGRHAKDAQKPIIIAYDTRFLADRFAALAATRLAAAGHNVLLGQEYAATPGIGAAIVAQGAAFGLMITASHNPPEYLGLKIKGAYGGSATPDVITAVEAELQQVRRIEASRPVALPRQAHDRIAPIDINAIHLRRLANWFPPASERCILVHDAMYGSGRGLLAHALAETNGEVINLRATANPGFDGVGPEPIAARLAPLMEAVPRYGAALGIATDGDADRVAAVDDLGTFVYPHEIFALMVQYLVDEQGRSGRVVRNLATSELVRRVAENRGLTVTTTPVGFKHIVAEMLHGDVLIGGEESGGIAVADYLPERDGILCGLILRELVVRRGKSLRALLDELYATYGNHVYRRWDLHLPEADKQQALTRLAEAPPQMLDGTHVTKVERTDGTKLHSKDGWLLIRASGTEPILRVYVEAGDTETVERRYQSFQQWLQHA